MAHDVFISHSKHDKAIADALCAGVEAAKIRCWVAPRDIQPRQEWAEAIIDAISDCKVFVIILSTGSNESPQVLREVESAVNKGKIIIPFRIEDCKTSKGLEYYLNVIHWLDAMNKPIEKHIKELVTVLQGIVSGETIDQPPEPPIVDPPRNLGLYGKSFILSAVLLILIVGIILLSGPPSGSNHDGQESDAPIVHSPSDGKVVYE